MCSPTHKSKKINKCEYTDNDKMLAFCGIRCHPGIVFVVSYYQVGTAGASYRRLWATWDNCISSRENPLSLSTVFSAICSPPRQEEETHQTLRLVFIIIYCISSQWWCNIRKMSHRLLIASFDHLWRSVWIPKWPSEIMSKNVNLLNIFINSFQHNLCHTLICRLLLLMWKVTNIFSVIHI